MSSLQASQQLVHRRGVELLVVMAVDHDHRRAATGGHAFFLPLEVDAAVGGRFAELAAQLLLRLPSLVLGAVAPAPDFVADRLIFSAHPPCLATCIAARSLVSDRKRLVQCNSFFLFV